MLRPRQSMNYCMHLRRGWVVGDDDPSGMMLMGRRRILRGKGWFTEVL
jgi:hypothetical protein